MANRTSHRLPSEPPPPAVMEEIGRHLSRREMQAVEALFALRTTAQQVDNAITEWLADTVGSPARLQILVLLWAARGSGIPHKEIVAALGVTRATVSGLMAALEREGLVKSSVDRDDRRNLLAILTSRGKVVVGQVIAANTSRLRAAFASLSSAELTTFTALLQRVREGFAASVNAASVKPPSPRLSAV
jgi:DNA-binding MarR family transcriptional regulator